MGSVDTALARQECIKKKRLKHMDYLKSKEEDRKTEASTLVDANDQLSSEEE